MLQPWRSFNNATAHHDQNIHLATDMAYRSADSILISPINALFQLAQYMALSMHQLQGRKTAA